jgi:hypothetical protein
MKLNLTKKEQDALTGLIEKLQLDEYYEAKSAGLSLEQFNKTPQSTSMDKIIRALNSENN